MNAAKTVNVATKPGHCVVQCVRRFTPAFNAASLTSKTAVFFLLLVAITAPAQAQTETVLYSFTGGADGAYPTASLIEDPMGNLYGTTVYGGDPACTYGCGTVFRVRPGGREDVLHSFTGGDGAYPTASVIQDAQGTLYGTTQSGGTSGSGTVFMVKPTGVEKVLYSFRGAPDGDIPIAGLIRDGLGNLLGTTESGGVYNRGSVFKVRPSGAESVLYSFTGGADGWLPIGGLIQDPQGTLYSTTEEGGTFMEGGTVFSLDSNGTERVFHVFTGKDGAWPQAGLIQTQGFLYGTTAVKGAYNCGNVFLVSSSGAYKANVLHSFAGGVDDGCNPMAGLVQDTTPYFYGTTQYGGAYNCGTVFRVNPSTGAEKVLYSFTGGADGCLPFAGLIRDALDPQGPLYGTTMHGGAYGYGTVFALLP